MLLIVAFVGLDLSGLQFLLVVLLFGGFGFGWGLHSFVVVLCRFAVPVVDGGCLVCMFAGLGCFLLLLVCCCLFVLWFVWLCTAFAVAAWGTCCLWVPWIVCVVGGVNSVVMKYAIYVCLLLLVYFLLWLTC